MLNHARGGMGISTITGGFAAHLPHTPPGPEAPGCTLWPHSRHGGHV